MAVGKNPLHFVSYSGPDPSISLDDEKFQKLESALGKRINQQARGALVDRCDEYLSLRHAEVIRQTWKDVERLLGTYKRAEKMLSALAFKKDRHSDAGSALSSIMDDAFRRQYLRLDAEADLLHMEPDKAEAGIMPVSDRYEIPKGNYFVRLSEELLREVAMCLKASVGIAEEILTVRSSEAATMKPTAAIDILIIRLTEWAKANYLPVTPYLTKDGYDPAPFANFMAELLSLMPEQYREGKHNDPGGIAAKTQRVRASHKKRQMEQQRKNAK